MLQGFTENMNEFLAQRSTATAKATTPETPIQTGNVPQHASEASVFFLIGKSIKRLQHNAMTPLRPLQQQRQRRPLQQVLKTHFS